VPDVCEIVDVSARDGLQNESVIFDSSEKLRLIEHALNAGFKRLEVASFVHPKRVPQMADAEAVISGLPNLDDVTYIGLVLNKRGLLRGFETRAGGKRGIDEIGLVAIATDTFGQKNQGQTSRESAELCRDMLKMSAIEGMSAQVTISAAFGCPFEGRVSLDWVVDLAKIVAEGEPREIAIADTIGVGSPARVTDLVGMLRDALPDMPLRAHFHNTRGTGLANAYAAYQAGVRTLDASIGGLGGCPFAPKATGNIAAEDLIFMLQESDINTGIDLSVLLGMTDWLEGHLGRKVPSSVAQAGGFPNVENDK